MPAWCAQRVCGLCKYLPVGVAGVRRCGRRRRAATAGAAGGAGEALCPSIPHSTEGHRPSRQYRARAVQSVAGVLSLGQGASWGPVHGWPQQAATLPLARPFGTPQRSSRPSASRRGPRGAEHACPLPARTPRPPTRPQRTKPHSPSRPVAPRPCERAAKAAPAAAEPGAPAGSRRLGMGPTALALPVQCDQGSPCGLCMRTGIVHTRCLCAGVQGASAQVCRLRRAWLHRWHCAGACAPRWLGKGKVRRSSHCPAHQHIA